MKQLNYKETVENLRNLLKKYIIKSKINSLVLGISGGIDSALVAALVKPVVDELGIPLIGRSITIETNSEDEQNRAREIGNLFCTDFQEVNLSTHFETLKEFEYMEDFNYEIVVDNAYMIRLGNIKARMRMMYLYGLASRNNGLVLSTDNRSEYLEGFWSLHGDIGDYGLIQELWKTEVYDIASYFVDEFNFSGDNKKAVALNRCILCDATDGLGISNTDLDQILPDWKNRHTSTRSGYKEVDNILIDYLKLTEKLIDKTNNLYYTKILEISRKILKLNEHPVIKRYLKTQFKRTNPYNEKRENFICN